MRDGREKKKNVFDNKQVNRCTNTQIWSHMSLNKYEKIPYKLNDSGCWTVSENKSERMMRTISMVFQNQISISIWHFWLWKCSYIQLQCQYFIAVVDVEHGWSSIQYLQERY